MLTILSAIVGGLFRFFPEILKYMDKKNDRAHELEMLERNMDYDRLRGDLNIRNIEAQSAAQIDLEEVKGWIATSVEQAKKTGFKLADSINALVRPVLAIQWLIILWPAVVVTTFIVSVQHGVDVLSAANAAFGESERSLCASIASFWLVDRSLRKGLFKR